MVIKQRTKLYMNNFIKYNDQKNKSLTKEIMKFF